MSSDTLTAILFVAVVARHPRHHVLGQPPDPRRRRLLRRRPLVHRLPERHGHLRRLHVGGVVPRHLRRHRADGYDGFLYSIGFLVAWLVALLLVAELLRNSGRYTMADQLAYRMRQRPVRTAAATSTVVVSIFYLLAQMVGAGALVALLLGVDRASPLKAFTIVGRRPADDLLRHRRRHEGHHLGADRQGRAADGRHDPDHGPGAGEVQLQPLRPARRRRREHRQGRGVPRARPEVRRHRPRRRSTSSASASRWCSARPACRTS